MASRTNPMASSSPFRQGICIPVGYVPTLPSIVGATTPAARQTCPVELSSPFLQA